MPLETFCCFLREKRRGRGSLLCGPFWLYQTLRLALNSKSFFCSEWNCAPHLSEFRSELGITGDINQIPSLPFHFTAEKTEAPERPRVRATPNSMKKDKWKATTKSKTSNKHLKMWKLFSPIKSFTGEASSNASYLNSSRFEGTTHSPLNMSSVTIVNIAHLWRLLICATNHAKHFT